MSSEHEICDSIWISSYVDHILEYSWTLGWWRQTSYYLIHQEAFIESKWTGLIYWTFVTQSTLQLTAVFLSFWTTVATEEQANIQALATQTNPVGQTNVLLALVLSCHFLPRGRWVWKHCQLDSSHCHGGAVRYDIRDEDTILGIKSLDEADSATVLVGLFYQGKGTPETVFFHLVSYALDS